MPLIARGPNGNKLSNTSNITMRVIAPFSLFLALSAHRLSAFHTDNPRFGRRGGPVYLNYLETLERPGEATTSQSSSDQAYSPSPPGAVSTPSRPYDLRPAPVNVVEPTRQPLASTQAPPGFGGIAPSAVSATTKAREVPIYEKYGDVDAEARLARSAFPIKANDLLILAKEAVFVKGLGMRDNGECLADDFVFRGAHVETKKPEFLKAIQSFDLGDSFEIKQQYFGWLVDPIQNNRVWFMNRQEATHVKDFFGAEADGKTLILPPESLHIDFNEKGQVTEFGFYTVDRFQGNTGGIGGAFGYFYGVGKPLPFPEARPYKMSNRRRVFETLGESVSKVKSADVRGTLKNYGSRALNAGASVGARGVQLGSQCKDFVAHKLHRNKGDAVNGDWHDPQ